MDDLIELQVMAEVFKSLEKLPDNEAKARVLQWIEGKLQLPSVAPLKPKADNKADTKSEEPLVFDSFPDMYHAFNPKSEKEKALVGAYWLRLGGATQFASMEVNKLLKDLGHGVANITDALSSAMSEKPALIMQVKKSGSSRQSRKQYKITDSGSKFLAARLQEA